MNEDFKNESAERESDALRIRVPVSVWAELNHEIQIVDFSGHIEDIMQF